METWTVAGSSMGRLSGELAFFYIRRTILGVTEYVEFR
jgi:hypothetical protein